MSIAVNTNYSGAVNAYTSVNTAKQANNIETTTDELHRKLNIDLYVNSVTDDREAFLKKQDLDSRYTDFFRYNCSVLDSEDALSWYEKGRTEIINVYGNDAEILDNHLKAFDRGFEQHLQWIAKTVTGEMELETKQLTTYAKNNIGYEGHKLATNKDFNIKEFESNIKVLMKEFGQSFLQRINEGFDFTEAKKNTIEYMVENTKTTSVNKLSYSDFMVVAKCFMGDGNVPTARGDKASKTFNNSTELSAELKALLR